MTIPVDSRDLAALARFAADTRNLTVKLWAEASVANRPEASSLHQLHMDGAAALTRLRAIGAPMPNKTPPAPVVPLELLDTRANRHLLRVLEEAVEAAQRVDQERGNFDPDEPYDGPATLPIVEILARVQLEVRGPAGAGEGAET